MRKVKNIKLRTTWLTFLGIPCVVPIGNAFEDPYLKILYEGAIFFYIAVVIISHVSLKKFTSLVATASVLAALTIVWSILGLKYFNIGADVHKGIDATKTFTVSEKLELGYLRQAITMCTVIPYMLFFVQSFSISEIIRSRPTSNKHMNSIRPVLAMCLGVLQYTTEGFYPLLEIWREENPSIVLPRHRGDSKGLLRSIAMFGRWATDSLMSWMAITLTLITRPIPIFYRQINFLYRSS